ncbi:MAG: PQQ-dependent sugar dehydrogenase [Pseudomonadota bacterium]
MLIERIRKLFLGLTLGLLASCGGGGGSPTPAPPAPLQGTLALTINGLPAGVAAQVKVSGPAGFSQSVTASQTLSALAPGNYTVSGERVVNGALSYDAAPASQAVAIAAGGTGTATVTYSAVPLKIALRELVSVPGAVSATAPQGDTRLFVVERAGRVRIVQDGAQLATPFLDISSRVSTQGEGGLLSIAFHPQYASNGLLFLYYTDLGNNIVIERQRVSANANAVDPASALVIIRIPHPNFTNHYGGTVAFGPDGMLYLATGDGGGAGDPPRNAQNPASLLGKILRLDVSAASSAQPYAIPSTNPWSPEMSSRRAEVWALGLRNPWRFTFDSGNIYIADVGQDRREEVNIAASGLGGLNYGWNTMEGTLCYGGEVCVQGGLTLPAFEYDHGSNDANGCSITGGFVYRGSALPELAGHYLYSDYCKGFLKSFRYAAGAVSGQTDYAIPDIGNVVSFGRDGAGELLLIAASGRVYRIVRAN